MPTQPSYPPGSVNEYQLRLGRQRQVGMVHSVSGCTRGVQVKLWNPLRTSAILEHLRGVFTTRRYTKPRLHLPFTFKLILHENRIYEMVSIAADCRIGLLMYYVCAGLSLLLRTQCCTLSADKLVGHETQHEREHLSEAVQDGERGNCRTHQKWRRCEDRSWETERFRQDLAGERRGMNEDAIGKTEDIQRLYWSGLSDHEVDLNVCETETFHSDYVKIPCPALSSRSHYSNQYIGCCPAWQIVVRLSVVS